jgi:hypothetical protein
MRIEQYTAVSPKEWDAFVEASPSAWLYHLSDWMALERKYWFPESHSFMIRAESGEPLGVLPLYFTKLNLGTGRFVERLLHSGVHRHTGLASAPSLIRKQLKRVQAAAMQEVFRIAEQVEADRIQLNEQNLAPANLPPHRQEISFFVEDFHFFFGLGLNEAGGITPEPGRMNCNSDQIIMLDQPEEALFANLSEPTQRGVRRARREAIQVFEAGSAAEYKDFVDLRLDAQRRTGQAVMPEAYYADIFDGLCAAGRSNVLLAKLKEKLIGGVQFLTYKGASSFFAGFAVNEYLHLHVNDLLHWESILWSKRQGLECYRLGPHFPDLPTESEAAKKGRFKKKFGGQPFHILQASYFLSPDKYLSKA